ncbi:unnamed protein product [Somion occarium]|uniref:Yeast cell wall synthesis Kre9/Knh1-like N-terminal domain-containing protein n=1 Tax=Somion occarium TaxID=3059160 RepID=A0ABP1E1D8_9APHY
MMLSTLVSALPVNMQVRDVFVPPITLPKEGTVWKVGTKQNVTWDTSDAPTQITNPIGRIILSKGGLLDLDNPLADGFDILLGEFEVTVPDVEPADDYAIVLFGDSGNASPQFTIEA